MTTAPADLSHLLDRAAIIDTVNAMAFFADARDWARVRACFDAKVFVDYTSLAGGEPAEQDADALIAAWRATLPGFDATQHIVTNHQVTLAGDRATCLSHFRAQHSIDEGTAARVWELDGDYDHGLVRTADGWRIARLVMTWTFERGDRALGAEAAARVKAEG